MYLNLKGVLAFVTLLEKPYGFNQVQDLYSNAGFCDSFRRGPSLNHKYHRRGCAISSGARKFHGPSAKDNLSELQDLIHMNVSPLPPGEVTTKAIFLLELGRS